MKKEEVAILIPCYNEDMTIGKVIKDIKKSFGSTSIYVGDNHSTDKTASIAHQEQVNVIEEKNRGKGNMLKKMLECVEADYYVLIDGDDTYDAEDIIKLLDIAKAEKADLVIGNRLKDNHYDNCDKKRIYTIGNRLANKVVNIRYHSAIEDVMSGLRVMSRNMIKNWNIQSTGFEIETEMTVFAIKEKYNIKQIPIRI